MTPAALVERIFADETVPAPLAGPHPPGVLVLRGTDPDGVAGHGLLFQPSQNPVACGLAELPAPGTRAAVLTGTAGDLWLSLRFALRLRAGREHGRAPGPCLTSTTQPSQLPTGVVGLPHLVAVDNGWQITDQIVWEVMPLLRVHAWLGGSPFPDDPQWFIDWLPGLLALRARHRDGLLLDPGYQPLRSALEGRYLSILFACTHPLLIADALQILGHEQAARR